MGGRTWIDKRLNTIKDEQRKVQEVKGYGLPELLSAVENLLENSRSTLSEKELAEFETLKRQLTDGVTADFEANIANTIGELEKSYRKTRRMYKVLFVMRAAMIFAVVYIFLVFSVIYSFLLYPQIPRTLGGGRPATIVLSFKPEYPSSKLLLPSDTANHNNTTTILLLAELTDGLLVASPYTGRVVAVKNEAIIAVIDDEVSEGLILLTSTPTPTNTPVPTETPIPTATPTL